MAGTTNMTSFLQISNDQPHILRKMVQENWPDAERISLCIATNADGTRDRSVNFYLNGKRYEAHYTCPANAYSRKDAAVMRTMLESKLKEQISK